MISAQSYLHFYCGNAGIGKGGGSQSRICAVEVLAVENVSVEGSTWTNLTFRTLAHPHGPSLDKARTARAGRSV